MEYPRLIAQVPAGEHFDASAVGEGVWLSVGHINNLETVLEQSAITLTQRTADIEAATSTITELTEQVSTLEQSANDAATRNTQQAARILELEAQVAQLGAVSSGNGSTIVAKEDEQVDKKPVPSYLDDNNPINQLADKRLRRK